MQKELECWLCGQEAELLEDNKSFYKVDCNACGTYRIEPATAEEIKTTESSCKTDLCRRVQSWMSSHHDRVIDQDVLKSISE